MHQIEVEGGGDGLGQPLVDDPSGRQRPPRVYWYKKVAGCGQDLSVASDRVVPSFLFDQLVRDVEFVARAFVLADQCVGERLVGLSDEAGRDCREYNQGRRNAAPQSRPPPWSSSDSRLSHYNEP